MQNFSPMTTFDKVCAVFSIGIGAIFMVLGGIGFFIGSSAHFRLPPLLGGLPFFLGWGMCIPLIRYWKMSLQLHDRRADDEHQSPNPFA
jgi:hypothetical protein